MADTAFHRYRIAIEARSPLAFPTSKPGTQFQASLGYVPGSALYGALGACLYQQQAFDLELMEQIRCHNAYPLPATAEPLADLHVAPLPATALQPKDTEHAPLVDALVGRVCWEQQRPDALIYAPVDPAGRPLDPQTGFYVYDSTGACLMDSKHPTTLTRPNVTQRVLTRVAINRRRGTAEDQRLYSPLVINEATRTAAGHVPTRFLGSLEVPAAHRETLRNALDAVDRLGGRQTTGLGAVEITATDQDAADAAAIKARIGGLTQLFQAQAQRYEDLGGDAWEIADHSILTINLRADAILLDECWMPTQQFSAAMLREATGIDARLLRSFADTRTVGGWNVSWQRPKPTALATTMGSVFVFEVTRPLTTDDYTRLARLQHDGIGERRAEGYGQVCVCDAFHRGAATTYEEVT